MDAAVLYAVEAIFASKQCRLVSIAARIEAWKLRG